LNVRAAFFVDSLRSEVQAHGGGGAIVNVSSQMGHVGAAMRTSIAVRARPRSLTKALAVELAPRESGSIRVSDVHCNAMTAPMFASAGFRAEVIAKIPLGRVGTADEVTAPCLLLSPAASLITGSSLSWTADGPLNDGT